ncbi:MAG: demethoxyubiquinone hydroxylase family protein [Rhizobiales bacterium]|nr:demethoxyubiquinone hydroxylase family protein [Hyphomicrobiales bacterium]
MTEPITARDALTIARICRVNHAGEHGAIRIYGAQIAVARHLYPDIVAELAEMRDHEIRHRGLFAEAMPARHSRPCRIMTLWALGGSVLGLATALLGRQRIWICTAAVEEAVHRHLDDQLRFLAGRDAGLQAAILDIRAEELAHLANAEAKLGPASAADQALRRVIAALTDILIWLSTWGDSRRMAADLKPFRAPD